jgi:CBS domain-containing protein
VNTHIIVRRRLIRRVGRPIPIAERSVGDWMTRTGLTVRDDLSLGDALTVMVRGGIRHLVIVDSVGRCAGVLPDRVVASAFARDPSALTWQRVADVVDTPPALVGVESTVADVARVMCASDVDAVAVVDADGRPVGLATAGDLVALLAAEGPA